MIDKPNETVAPIPVTPTLSNVRLSSMVKIVSFALFAYGVFQLVPLFMLLFLSGLLAITFVPIVDKLQKKRIPRWVAFSGIASLILILFSLCVFIIIPQLVEQLSTIPKLVNSFRAEYVDQIKSIWVRTQIEAILNSKMFGAEMPEHLMKIGSKIVEVLIEIGIILVFTFYFMLDGRRAYYWAISFFNDEHRQKIHRTTKEFNVVVTKYISGQFIVSAMVGVYVFSILTILNVPLALTLGFVAAGLEVLPIFGFLSSLFIVVLVTASVAPTKALLVFSLFVIYHFFDAYILMPKVYGNRMRMSGLVVLISLLIAVKLGGIIAGILVLPLIASYPTVEKIWLKKYIGKRTVREHQKLEEILNKPPPTL